MNRYLEASATFAYDAQMPAFAPKGHCQWCGKLRPGRGRFCKQVKREVDERANWDWCYYHWSAWALSRPRFQRVVLIRDAFTCQKCGVHPASDNVHGVTLPDLGELHVDHIVPLAGGGKTALDNLQTLCRRCNLGKGKRMPHTVQDEMDLAALG